MSGFLGDLSDHQQHTLQQFRTKLADVLDESHDDHNLLRWLRARQFNLSKAEKMFRDHLKFRAKYDCDNLIDHWKPPKALTKYMIGGLFGHDKDGNPVWYDPFGCLDSKGIYYSTTKHDFLKYKILACEKIQKTLRERTKETGQRYERITVVFDLEYAGFSHLWRPFTERYSHVLKLYEANYPEQLKRCIIVNAPKMFSVGFQWIQPLISEETKRKVIILDCNYKEKLKEYISEDQLPGQYGGTATVNGDPKCQPDICYGGKVPLSYYLRNSPLSQKPSMLTCQVHHGKYVDLTYQVNESGSILKWEFQSEHDDVGFGVFLKSEDKLEEVLNVERYNCHVVPESGGITCQEKGSYIVRFDNTFSWVKNKTVHYNVEVLSPEQPVGS